MENWNKTILLSSVPLRQIGNFGMPINFASGCLIDYNENHILLTVSHATDNNGKWAIEVSAKDNLGTQLYKLGTMNFLKSIDLLTEEEEKIDFSYTTVPNEILPFYHILDENNKIQKKIPRLIHKINFEYVPCNDKKYGFSGNTMFRQDDFILQSINRLVKDLKYVGDEGLFYKFKLPIKHPGHEYFKGTSGAPIIDEDGNVAALVCKGDIYNDIIYGIPLKNYKIFIDILLSEASSK
jgi:hypothetical protein